MIRSDRRANRRFTRSFGLVVVVLVVLVAGLAAAGAAVNFAQAPRLASVEIDLDRSIVHAGSRLSLTANQPLAEIEAGQVSVTPKTAVSTSVSGAELTVRFTGILRYNTEYTVTVTDVAGSARNAAATLDYRFTTPDPGLYALQRDDRVGEDGAKLPDTVRRTTLRGRGDGEVVFSAPRIQQYVALDSHLAAVTLDDAAAAAIEVVSFAGGETIGETVRLPLPSAGTVENLQASPSRHLIAYTFTSGPAAEGRRHQKTPFIYDLTAESGLPEEVAGADGPAVEAMDLAFVPDTASLVVHDSGHSLFLVDVLGDGALEPLGVHAEMRGFVPGSRALILADPERGSTLDLADGEVTPFELAPSPLDEAAYPGKLILLNEQGRYARLYLQESTGINDLISLIAVTDDDGSNVVFTPASESSRVRDVCASPNGQYLAVETIAGSGRADAYRQVPAFSGMSTTFVDLATGTSTRSVSGFMPDWCTG
ncbi:hypothetical protein E3T37_02020 [Cryobacterium sp. TMT2-10]|uniref:Ig-like domain-containing protein n=1 Tax=Cryobacterium sp. TMT2-10 TaxID=1259244 RepID=UPI00106B3AE1|nr:Ig-like domain-containing protein [Cryobacterium sp. TMT2-10]TFD42689.1 hypothetical protein E3T37_02020 [Cryobacterium sp. TMT2-10]